MHSLRCAASPASYALHMHCALHLTISSIGVLCPIGAAPIALYFALSAALLATQNQVLVVAGSNQPAVPVTN